jgi:regulator of protease activity HflC (stomatin/prohibitin superfamily)
MNNNLIKLLAADSGDTIKVIVAVVIFLLLAVLLFIYLASCIVIVKQGTRKIVERFGSYNRTLKEGIHIIFRPFDKIAPVPWNILSISERDAFDKNMARRRIPFFNDDRREMRSSTRDLARIERSRANIYRKMEKDIRLLTREKYIDNSTNVSAAYSGSLDMDRIVYNSTGRKLNEVIDGILESENSLQELELAYREMGLDAYRADESLVSDLIERDRERQALAASIKYYPRHQDPHSRRAGIYPMAENHIQDFVDLRERHIDTSNDKVRKLFALKLDGDLHFPKGATFVDALRKNYKVLNSPTRFSGVNLITKDNASIGANIVIFFSVTDPFLYYYGVDEPEESLVLLAITTLRNIVSGLTLEEALQARAEINKQIREELDIATNNWGIKANRVEVKEFELGYSMQKAMDDVLIAEREKRANILRAEGYRKMKDEQVMAEHIRLKGYETLEEVSRGPANKVFIPSDLSDFITGAHVVADAFKDGKSEKKPEEAKASE